MAKAAQKWDERGCASEPEMSKIYVVSVRDDPSAVVTAQAPSAADGRLTPTSSRAPVEPVDAWWEKLGIRAMTAISLALALTPILFGWSWWFLGAGLLGFIATAMAYAAIWSLDNVHFM